MTVWLFAGDSYYPSGGWDDFVGEYRKPSKAKARVDETRTETRVPARVSSHSIPDVIASSTGSFLTDRRIELVVGAKYGGGIITEKDAVADTITVAYPERVDVDYEFDWAHIVQGGRIVATWYDGCWKPA